MSIRFERATEANIKNIIDPVSLYQNIMKVGIEAGKCEALVDNFAEICPALILQDEKLKLLFTKAIDPLKMQISNLEDICILNSVRKFVSPDSPVFVTQVKLINESLKSSENKLTEVFTSLFEKTVESSKKGLPTLRDRLNDFRNASSLQNLLAAKAEAQKSKAALAHVTFLGDLSRRYSIILSSEQDQDIQISRDYPKIFDLLLATENTEPVENVRGEASFKQLAALFNRLALISHAPESVSKDDRIQLESDFDSFLLKGNEAFRNALDGAIYKLSPEPKGGDEWGKHNRYKDLSIFKQAFAKVMQERLESNWRSENEEEFNTHVDDFYTALHFIALGPKDEDPIAWAKKEFPSLLYLSEKISTEDLKEVAKMRSERQTAEADVATT